MNSSSESMVVRGGVLSLPGDEPPVSAILLCFVVTELSPKLSVAFRLRV